jgi:hypothetical protein
LFNLYESWVFVAYSNLSDVKELLPEFYRLLELFDNRSGLPLTTTTGGRDIANVGLGNFCRNAQDFVGKLRYVVRRLPAWIDLIFGCKWRGHAAMEAKNVFHPLCYVAENETEQAESEDQIEREAMMPSGIRKLAPATRPPLREGPQHDRHRTAHPPTVQPDRHCKRVRAAVRRRNGRRRAARSAPAHRGHVCGSQ